METRSFGQPLRATTVQVGVVTSVSGSRMEATLRSARDGAAASSGEVGEGVQIGGLIRVPGRKADVYGIVQSMRVEYDSVRGAGETRVAEIQVFGEVPHTDSAERHFERGVSAYPALGAGVYTTNRDDLAIVYAPTSVSNVRIGALSQDSSVPAYVLTDDLLGKHFAILGTTGCGKSCTVALILRSILSEHPNGHIVLLDPHSEYSRAFGRQAEVVRPDDLDLPYWVLNFEETASLMTAAHSETREQETAILKRAVLDARQKYANGKDAAYITVDTPVPYRLGDLLRYIDQKMGELEKADNSVPFLRLKARVEALGADKRLGFMFPGHMVRDNLEEILARLLRIPVSGKPVTLLDISGMPGEVVDVVVSVICRIIFDYALWSDRDRSAPILLVCEEAHRYVPQADSAGFEPTKRALSRIAKEGRKYGISLCLVTQRPSELSMSILSQCNTLFALRMSNERDHEFVRNALPECAQSFLSSLPALRTREAIVVGEGVPVPMRLRFEELAAAFRPHSDSAVFSASWRRPDEASAGSMVAETIRRWRVQGRSPAAASTDAQDALRSVLDRGRSQGPTSPILRPKYDPQR
jgi:DNA helicase HerA-like ATPase